MRDHVGAQLNSPRDVQPPSAAHRCWALNPPNKKAAPHTTRRPKRKNMGLGAASKSRDCAGREYSNLPANRDAPLAKDSTGDSTASHKVPANAAHALSARLATFA